MSLTFAEEVLGWHDTTGYEASPIEERRHWWQKEV